MPVGEMVLTWSLLFGSFAIVFNVGCAVGFVVGRNGVGS